MKHWYTCAMVALRRAGPNSAIGLTPITITAIDDAAAYKHVMGVCLEHFPAWDGWTDQNVSITRIEQVDIDALLASMRE